MLLALCYHYLRPAAAQDRFPRILGTPMREFRRQVNRLRSDYAMCSPQQVRAMYAHPETAPIGQPGVLLTFDDGLAEHYAAAQWLAQQGIAAWFFIPTCILKDELPANPTILHYGIAVNGLGRFARTYHAALEAQGLSREAYGVPLTRGTDDVWTRIAQLKTMLYYRLPPARARAILLQCYRELLWKNDPDILSAMHLTSAQVREMLAMGHAIGVHSHSHVSGAAPGLTSAEWEAEVVEPKRYLEDTFGTQVVAFSYPFGEQADRLDWETRLRQTLLFELAFTIEPAANTPSTSPWQLGRVMLTAAETAQTLMARVQQLLPSPEPAR